jgi:hypothetical protein
MKTKIMALVFVILTFQACQRKPQTEAHSVTTMPNPNTLKEEEKAVGWELLFDGSTLNGWKRYNADTIGPMWIVNDNMIVCNGEGLTEGTKKNGGSLTTIRRFGNFELSVDWKISPGGNSGILYHVVEEPQYKHEYETGPEYQVLDDVGWKDKMTPAQAAGSNYDMYAAPAGKKLMPVGEWNTSRIIYNNGHVEHWLNGIKTVEFEEGSDDYETRYKKSKWIKYPGWNKSKTGSISLQDHGANVYFRNIKVKVL